MAIGLDNKNNENKTADKNVKNGGMLSFWFSVGCWFNLANTERTRDDYANLVWLIIHLIN